MSFTIGIEDGPLQKYRRREFFLIRWCPLVSAIVPSWSIFDTDFKRGIGHTWQPHSLKKNGENQMWKSSNFAKIHASQHYQTIKSHHILGFLYLPSIDQAKLHFFQYYDNEFVHLIDAVSFQCNKKKKQLPRDCGKRMVGKQITMLVAEARSWDVQVSEQYLSKTLRERFVPDWQCTIAL